MNKIFNSEVRVKILATLYGLEYCEFNYLRDKLNTSEGNLWAHLKKLEKVEYISIKKRPVNNKIRTMIYITSKGRVEFKKFICEILELSNTIVNLH